MRLSRVVTPVAGFLPVASSRLHSLCCTSGRITASLKSAPAMFFTASTDCDRYALASTASFSTAPSSDVSSSEADVRSALVKSALVRPVTPQQLVFTYLIPLIPLFYAWDGQASMPRIYWLEDLEELLEGLEDPGYTWEKGHGTSKRGGKLGTYLLGMPV